jgi:hypothetical protein
MFSNQKNNNYLLSPLHPFKNEAFFNEEYYLTHWYMIEHDGQ